GADAYESVMSSTRLPKRSRASATTVTCSSIVYTVRSGSTARTSELGNAGTTIRRSASTSAAPVITHETSYSPAAVAVTAVWVAVMPAPNGEIASAWPNAATGLLNASKARHPTPTGTPATATRLSSWVSTRTGGPAMISSSSGDGSTRSRSGAEQRT